MNDLWTRKLLDEVWIVLEATIDLQTMLEVCEIRLVELRGSGAGDQYLIQGKMDLGKGLKSYSLSVYSLMETARVDCIGSRPGSDIYISKAETEAGFALARKIVDTLSDDLMQGMQHDLAWLKRVWNQ